MALQYCMGSSDIKWLGVCGDSKVNVKVVKLYPIRGCRFWTRPGGGIGPDKSYFGKKLYCSYSGFCMGK